MIENLTWPMVAAVAMFPICAMKQAINVVQFGKASEALTAVDIEERKNKRRK